MTIWERNDAFDLKCNKKFCFVSCLYTIHNNRLELPWVVMWCYYGLSQCC